jgi:hypothetical protein
VNHLAGIARVRLKQEGRLHLERVRVDAGGQELLARTSARRLESVRDAHASAAIST